MWYARLRCSVCMYNELNQHRENDMESHILNKPSFLSFVPNGIFWARKPKLILLCLLNFSEHNLLSRRQTGPYQTCSGLITDVIWRQGSWSTLVQVADCCLVAPNHYMNQCWLTINTILWHWFQCNVYWNTQDSKPYASCVCDVHIWNHSHISQGTMN